MLARIDATFTHDLSYDFFQLYSDELLIAALHGKMRRNIHRFNYYICSLDVSQQRRLTSSTLIYVSRQRPQYRTFFPFKGKNCILSAFSFGYLRSSRLFLVLENITRRNSPRKNSLCTIYQFYIFLKYYENIF